MYIPEGERVSEGWRERRKLLLVIQIFVVCVSLSYMRLKSNIVINLGNPNHY